MALPAKIQLDLRQRTRDDEPINLATGASEARGRAGDRAVLRGLDERRAHARSVRPSAEGTGESRPSQTPRRRSEASPSSYFMDERRRMERDLHDGVQNELVALIARLALAQQHPDTPPAVATMLAELEARAQGALDSVRAIARGIYPSVLADFGIAKAMRAQALRATIAVSVLGQAPRSCPEAEEAVYFACLEAIQNAAKHAGAGARVSLRLHHRREKLTVRIIDDGRGFDPTRAGEGAGLRNIRDRLHPLGGSFSVASTPGHGTVLTVSLMWPPRAEREE